MRIGYARTSTSEQTAGFDAQVRELEAAGCDRIFKEQVSSVAHREQLEAALYYIRDGDTLVVTKLDRLARSVAHLVEITEAVSDMRRRNIEVDLTIMFADLRGYTALSQEIDHDRMRDILD